MTTEKRKPSRKMSFEEALKFLLDNHKGTLEALSKM